MDHDVAHQLWKAAWKHRTVYTLQARQKFPLRFVNASALDNIISYYIQVKWTLMFLSSCQCHWQG